MAGDARKTPVMPPMRNTPSMPMQKSIGVANQMLPRHMVAIQPKNLTPVGMAIRNEVIAKYTVATAPVVNMWCAQTLKLYAAIRIVAKTKALYPNSGLRLNTGMISVTTPKNGIAMM